MLAFRSAASALRCAIETQKAFAAYAKDHPDGAVRVRMGLHTGEVIKEADDFFGKNVILAARIAAQAKGGQVLVSSLVKDLTESAQEFTFGKPQQLIIKGLSGTYQVHALTC
jgi:class 3 adenylate cyclase